MKLRKSRKSSVRKSKKVRKSKTLDGGMMKHLSSMIYGDNSLPKADPPRGTRKEVFDKVTDDDYVNLSLETDREKERRQNRESMINSILINLKEKFDKTMDKHDLKTDLEYRNKLMKLSLSLNEMNDKELNEYYKIYVLDKY
jgi:hypothetical protein